MDSPLYHVGKTFFILGSSGFANEIRSYISDALKVPEDNIIFVDSAECSFCSIISVAEYQKRVNIDRECVSILGTGKPDIKMKMLSELRGKVFRFVHPHAVLSKDASIDEGSVVAPNAVISPFVVVGKHVLVNTNASIGHNSTLGDLSVVAPNAAIGGWCKIGERAYVGAGALIREHLKVGQDAMIGMGAVVTKDVLANTITIGNPAKTYTKEEWDARNR
jgi:acetyltransferase EpsM